MESTIEQELKRIADSFESMAESLAGMLQVERDTFDRKYPVITMGKEATVTFIHDEESKLREEQGATGEPTLEAWRDLNYIGPREQALTSAKEKKSEHQRRRRSEAAGRRLGGSS